jgi:GNAT superfamily N-acetyltransferase
MNIRIEPYTPDHLDAIVRLSMRAWEPVFKEVEIEMGPEKYKQYYPDWRASQTESVTMVCNSDTMPTWTALSDDNPVGFGEPIGFVGLKMHTAEKMGEIYIIATDPDAQGNGIATKLINFAVDYMKQHGMEMCIIDTGQDKGHAPARATYERNGFDMWPVARFYKEI